MSIHCQSPTHASEGFLAVNNPPLRNPSTLLCCRKRHLGCLLDLHEVEALARVALRPQIIHTTADAVQMVRAGRNG